MIDIALNAQSRHTISIILLIKLLFQYQFNLATVKNRKHYATGIFFIAINHYLYASKNIKTTRIMHQIEKSFSGMQS